MKRLLPLLLSLLFACSALAQVTTNPGITGVFDPRTPGAIGGTIPATLITSTEYRTPNGANLEYGSLTWGANLFVLQAVTNGGTDRNLAINVPASAGSIVLQTAGSTRVLATGTGFHPATTNGYDLGLTGTRWRTGYFATSVIAPTLTATTAVGVTGTLDVSGAVKFPGLATGSAATVGTLCQTVTTGDITVNTTVACLASSERYKRNIRDLDMGLREVMALRPVAYELLPEFNPTGLGEMPGLVAEEVERVDARLVGLDPDGTVQGVRYMQMVALAIKAIQEQQEQITELRAQLKTQQAALDALPQFRVVPIVQAHQ